jgi:ribosomal protein L35AE/L33A
VFLLFFLLFFSSLYAKAKIVNYQGGQRTQNNSVSLLKIEGVQTPKVRFSRVFDAFFGFLG